MHFYAGPHTYSWIIFSPDGAGGMQWSSPGWYSKLRDGVYIMAWVEEACNGGLGVILYNQKLMHDAGFGFHVNKVGLEPGRGRRARAPRRQVRHEAVRHHLGRGTHHERRQSQDQPPRLRDEWWRHTGRRRRGGGHRGAERCGGHASTSNRARRTRGDPSAARASTSPMSRARRVAAPPPTHRAYRANARQSEDTLTMTRERAQCHGHMERGREDWYGRSKAIPPSSRMARLQGHLGNVQWESGRLEARYEKTRRPVADRPTSRYVAS